MIVDDEPGIRDAVSRYLGQEGMDVIVACDGKECIEKIRNGFIGVILLDLYMPVLNGWDTIREIVKQGFTENVLIVLLTAATSAGPNEEGLKKYVLDYIPKPADMAQMAEAVKNYIQYFANDGKCDDGVKLP